MKTEQIIEKLDALNIDDTNEDEMMEEVLNLTIELSKNSDSHLACAAMISLLERHPNADFGGPGAIVHTLEDHSGHYETLLFESLKRQPTEYTVMLLQRIINGEKDTEKCAELLKLFKNCAKHPKADKQVKYSVKEYLKFRKSFEKQKTNRK
jgi:hypothetical protein